MRIKLAMPILMLLVLAAGSAFGQSDVKRPLTALSLDEPANLPQLSTTPSGPEGTVPAGSEEPLPPQVDTDGRVRGSSLSDRLQGIRRRAVDTAISRPFLVVDPRETENLQVEQQGTLPPVKRRSLKEPKQPVEVAQVPQAPEIEEPVQQPAPTAQQVPQRATTEITPQRTRNTTRSKSRQNTSPVSTMPVRETSNILLSNRASALSVETTGPKTIVIGRESSYHVTMLNTGELDAKNVIVSVSLPSWAEVTGFTASSGTPKVEAQTDETATLSWPISFLKAKGKEELTLKIVPRDSRPFDLGVGWAFAPEHSTAQIQVQEPKLEMNIHGPNEVTFGSTELFTISLSNPGTGDAESVVLNLMPLGAQQPIAGSRDLGTLRAGERKTIELELTAHQAGRLQVRAMAFADGGLRTESAQDVVVRRANLEIDVAGPPQTFASTNAVYQIRVQNTGDAIAEETTVTAALPPGCKFIGSTDGGRLEEEPGLVHWAIGAVRPGGVRIIEWNCELLTAGDNRIDVQCNASRQISAAKSVITKVEALADLKLRVNDPKGAVQVGADSTYEVSVTNRGTKAAEMVQVIGYFSDGIEPVALAGMRGNISTGQVAMEPINVIAPGQEITFRITARALQPGNHVFRAELQCDRPETRLAAEEWTKYYLSSSPTREHETSSPAPLSLGQRNNLGQQSGDNQFRQ